MAVKTKAQLVKRALQKLYVVSGTEEPKAEDAQLAGDVWATMRLELIARNIGGLEDNAIPVDIFEGVAAALAVAIAPDFGMTMPEGALDAAIRRINAAGGVPYSGYPAELNTY